jgi:hypothetical protein
MHLARNDRRSYSGHDDADPLEIVRLEPRVAAGPIALAGADMITILMYLSLARWLAA